MQHNRHEFQSGNAVLMRQVMKSILDFLLKSGMRSKEIRTILSECLAPVDGESRAQNFKPKKANAVGNGNVSAEVMRIWHRDARFLDRDANPRPLQLNRGANSLTALIKKLDPCGDAMKSVSVMRAVGVIRRTSDGRYVPTAESVKIDYLHPLAIEHIAKSIVRLVSTVCRNTDPNRQAIPLIERYAYAPDMSREEASAFAEFTRNQGMVYLEAVDDWLEQRRVKRRSTLKRPTAANSVAAGVHLFAYVDEIGARPARQERKSTRQLALSSRPATATSSRATPA